MKMTIAGLVLSGTLALAQGPEAGGSGQGMPSPMGKQGGMSGHMGGKSMGMGAGCMGGMQGGCPMMGGMMNAERLKEAGATEAQIKDVEALQSASEKDAVTLKAAAELAQLKMKEAMKADMPDEKAVSEAFDAVTAARAAQMKAGIMTMIKVKKILGADVMKKMKPEGRGPGMSKGGMRHGSDQGGEGCGLKPQQPTAPVKPDTTSGQ